jgi:hypothetical protein
MQQNNERKQETLTASEDGKIIKKEQAGSAGGIR